MDNDRILKLVCDIKKHEFEDSAIFELCQIVYRYYSEKNETLKKDGWQSFYDKNAASVYKASLNFDSKKYDDFPRYVNNYIHGNIVEEKNNKKQGGIKFSAKAKKHSAKVASIVDKFYKKNGYYPSNEVIQDILLEEGVVLSLDDIAECQILNSSISYITDDSFSKKATHQNNNNLIDMEVYLDCIAKHAMLTKQERKLFSDYIFNKQKEKGYSIRQVSTYRKMKFNEVQGIFESIRCKLKIHNTVLIEKGFLLPDYLIRKH